MHVRSRGPLLRSALALAAGGTAFHAACVAYRAATFALSSELTQGGIVLHVVGGDGRALVGLGRVAERAFASEAGMLATGAAAGLVALACVLWRAGSLTAPRAAAVASVLLAVGATAFGVDLHLGLTPWSESGWRSRGLVERGLAPERKLTVDEIRCLPDALSGSLAETEGVLAYHDGLRRFHLASPDGDGAYVKVFFFQRRRGGPSEMRGDGPPRHADQVAPLVGRRVRLVGRVVNGQIDVELTDVTPL
jgi:hypothetical protein